jgi:protein subunit release factor B
MISKKKLDDLEAKMRRFSVWESDLEEYFIRSRGPGGQNVNKTSTGVYVKHIPTGLEVKVMSERSQALNRYLARKILTARIEALALGRESEERRRIEKLRRQKRRRSKRAKEKMLADKRRHSEKKALRKKITSE